MALKVTFPPLSAETLRRFPEEALLVMLTPSLSTIVALALATQKMSP